MIEKLDNLFPYPQLMAELGMSQIRDVWFHHSCLIGFQRV